MSGGHGTGLIPRLGNRSTLLLAAAAFEDGLDSTEGRLCENRSNAEEQTANEERIEERANETKERSHGV